jgi:hypothetical protein
MNPLAETLASFGKTMGGILGVAAALWLLNEWHEHYIQQRINVALREKEKCQKS